MNVSPPREPRPTGSTAPSRKLREAAGRALIELFNGHTVAYGYWKRADRADANVVFPASAIAEANVTLKVSYNAWSALLCTESVHVAPLDTNAAIETGLHHRQDLATSHVVHEARAVHGLALTAEPNRYAGATVPLLVL